MVTTLRIKKIISLVLLLLVAISLFGCKPISKYEPYNYPNSLWVCEEPHMEIAVDTMGNLRSTIEINGEESCFAIGFRAMNAYAYKNLNDSTTLFGAIANSLRMNLRSKLRKIIYGTVLIRC